MVRRYQRISDFSGGINAIAQTYELDDSQSPDSQNCYMVDIDTTQSRLGVKPLSRVNTSGITITDLYTFKRDDSSELLLAFGGGNTYQFNATTSAWVSVPSGMSVWNQATRINFFQYQDTGYFRDGFTAYKLTGSAAVGWFTRAGVSAPSGTIASATSAGTGNLSGVYFWKYTYVNSISVESNPNSTAVSGWTFSSAGQASLTSFENPFASFGVNGYRIYRTAAGGSTYKYVASIAVGTANYTDNVPDGSLGAVIPSDNYPPPSGIVGIIQKDRAFYAVSPTSDTSNLNRAWYSNVATPEIVGAASFFRFGWDGEPVWTLAAGQDQLIVGKQKSIWELYMPSPGNPLSWYPKKVSSEYGSEMPWFAPAFADSFMMASRFGFITVDQQGTVPSTLQLASDSSKSKLASKFIYAYQAPTASSNLGPGRMTMSLTNIRNVSGIAFNNNIWIALTSTAGTSANDSMWLYNYVRGQQARGSAAWWRMANLNISALAVFNNALYGASSKADAFVYQLDVPDQYYDRMASSVTNGTLTTQNIDAYWRSKPFYGSEAEFNDYKDYVELRGVVSAQTGTNMQLRYITNNAVTFVASQAVAISQDPLIDQYGNSGTVANATRQFTHRMSAGISGRNLRVEVSNMPIDGASGVSGAAFKLLQLEIASDNRGRR